MRIGLIGVGNIGSTLASHFVRVGHDVAVSNSRGPETLEALVRRLGERAQAMTAADAARFGEIDVVSVPFGKYRTVPVDGFDDKAVIDTNNYYPGRDGQFRELDEDRTTSSEMLAAHLPHAHIVKAFERDLLGASAGRRPSHGRARPDRDPDLRRRRGRQEPCCEPD